MICENFPLPHSPLSTPEKTIHPPSTKPGPNRTFKSAELSSTSCFSISYYWHGKKGKKKVLFFRSALASQGGGHIHQQTGSDFQSCWRQPPADIDAPGYTGQLVCLEERLISRSNTLQESSYLGLIGHLHPLTETQCQLLLKVKNRH